MLAKLQVLGATHKTAAKICQYLNCALKFTLYSNSPHFLISTVTDLSGEVETSRSLKLILFKGNCHPPSNWLYVKGILIKRIFSFHEILQTKQKSSGTCRSSSWRLPSNLWVKGQSNCGLSISINAKNKSEIFTKLIFACNWKFMKLLLVKFSPANLHHGNGGTSN